jgi:hypothetical protein
VETHATSARDIDAPVTYRDGSDMLNTDGADSAPGD